VKIEFLENGSDDCPLIRIYGYKHDVCLRIKRVFEQLAQGVTRELSLSDLKGVESVDGCRFIAKAGKRDRGVLHDERNVFEWVLTPSTWDNVAGLIEPFCIPGKGGYQWLHQTGDIGVLISPTGCW